MSSIARIIASFVVAPFCSASSNILLLTYDSALCVSMSFGLYCALISLNISKSLVSGSGRFSIAMYLLVKLFSFKNDLNSDEQRR